MRKTWLWTSLVLSVLAGGSYALYLFLQEPPLPNQLVYGNGHVEGTEIRVAAEVGGRVVESRLVEGTAVAAGDPLVRLNDADLALRRDRAAATLKVLRHGREKTLRELEVAQHHLRTAESDLSRYRELRARDAVPPQRVEQAENAFQEARGHVAILEAEASAVEARIDAADKDLQLIANDLEKARITAPVDGTVLAKAVEAGEVVQPGQTVAVLVDLTRLELTVFVPEDEIGRIRLGAPARVRVDAFPERLFEGDVARIDQQAQFTPRDIHMPEERTRMVFGVTVALDNPDRILKPGMPADAWVLWRPEAGWPERLFVPG